MTATITSSYDEIPYEGRAMHSTHPNCLAVAGRIRGVAAAPPSSCRVLELGCGTGGNLIPMAYGLPNSRFVGVDLSQRQIADGQKLCQQLELTNIDLHAASIAAVDESWGEFDYIICHGVYSWVPPAIRERILWICRHLLSPQGVAYVSYNTYPGWRLKSVARDLMTYHSAKFDDPQEQVQQARSIINFIGKAAASENSFMGRVFAHEAENLAKAEDFYVYHEHLEEANQPFYFHEFIAQARAVGLGYLGEAWNQHKMDDLSPTIQETLKSISDDIIDLEQFLDFIRSRSFRRTLICHGDVQVEHAPDAAVMEPFLVAPLALPKSDQPSITSDQPEEFQMLDGSIATTNSPLWKAALVELALGSPKAMSFEDLFAAASSRSQLKQEDHAKARRHLLSMLMRGYVSHLVDIQCEPFHFTREVSPRPRASKLARLLALTSPRLPTLRHEVGEFSPAERAVLRQADGTRTIDQIVEGSRDAIMGYFNSQKDATPPNVNEFVAEWLGRFGRLAFLEA
jgi:methyltransferase-like protein/SAM-dependent methyltransferase